MNYSGWKLPLILAWTLAVIPAGYSQPSTQAPVQRNGFLQLTSYDTLQTFLRSLDGNGRVRIEKIATTRQGRSVTCCFVSLSEKFGVDTSKLRVMLFAQQHGDEPAGKEALTLLLAKFSDRTLDSLLAHVDLMIVPQMNPDGGELRKRRTADSIDLNRNHLLLTSPATKGLHDLFALWWPQVTLDVHEYGPFSEEWSDSGFIKRADVQLGMLTNLNSSLALRTYQREKVFPHIAAAMRDHGYAFHEYIVGSPGDLIRYSTTEPNDGRQSFGILNTLSFIQEGRGGTDLEDHLERRAKSQLASIEALLSYCSAHAVTIRNLVASERRGLLEGAGREVVLCMDHFVGGGSITIPVQLVPSGRDSVWRVRPLHDLVKPLATRRLPTAYVVPRELDSVIGLLERHHIHREVVNSERSVDASVYLVDSVQADTLEAEWHPKPFLRVEARRIHLRAGDVVVPTNQVHSIFLGILFEPESMWGLVKYPGFKALLESREYPIARIP